MIGNADISDLVKEATVASPLNDKPLGLMKMEISQLISVNDD